jgi:hypothetical protein
VGVFGGPNVSEGGLVLALDGGNLKSYSQNVFPYPLDGYSWGTSGHQMTVSRDTSTSSPVGNSPLKLVTSGAAAYTNTYNSLPFTLSPAAQGQTWTFSFWVKGSSSFSASMLIFESNSSGNYITYGQPYYSVTTEWTRVSGSYTMTQATTTGVQVRIDCYVNGVTLWVDGFQLEKASSASSLNSISNTNGTTWTDLSGNGNNGTLTNGPTYSSANGGSLVFDGVNDYVTLTNASNQFDFPGDFTVGLWIYPTQYHLTYQTMLDTYPGGATNGWIFTTMYGSTPVISWYTEGSSWQPSSTAVTLNAWNYLLASRIGTNVKLYKNATEILSHSDSSNIRGGDLNIGVGLNGSYGNIFGRISNVQIYKGKGLTAAEISQNFNALRGRFGI